MLSLKYSFEANKRTARSSSSALLAPAESRSAMCARLQPAEASFAALRCDCLGEPQAVRGLLCHLSHATELPPSALRLLAVNPAVTSAWDHTQTILSFGTRVPGDQGWAQTLQYIRWTMEELGWEVTADEFEASTPRGRVAMQNVVATFNPSGGECALDLAAHLDSKLFTEFVFLGASDSAASLGILLAAAQHLTPPLEAKVRPRRRSLAPKLQSTAAARVAVR